jgi:hypothetical protein
MYELVILYAKTENKNAKRQVCPISMIISETPASPTNMPRIEGRAQYRSKDLTDRTQGTIPISLI